MTEKSRRNYNNSVQKSMDDVHSYENRTQPEQQSYPEIERELEREKDTETDKDIYKEEEPPTNDVKNINKK